MRPRSAPATYGSRRRTLATYEAALAHTGRLPSHLPSALIWFGGDCMALEFWRRRWAAAHFFFAGISGYFAGHTRRAVFVAYPPPSFDLPGDRPHFPRQRATGGGGQHRPDADPSGRMDRDRFPGTGRHSQGSSGLSPGEYGPAGGSDGRELSSPGLLPAAFVGRAEFLPRGSDTGSGRGLPGRVTLGWLRLAQSQSFTRKRCLDLSHAGYVRRDGLVCSELVSLACGNIRGRRWTRHVQRGRGGGGSVPVPYRARLRGGDLVWARARDGVRCGQLCGCFPFGLC